MVKKSFLKGFGAKVLDQDTNRLPGMVIRSHIPWPDKYRTNSRRAGAVTTFFAEPL